MRYAAVATPAWLLLVDMQSRQVRPVERHRGEYYGISWFPDGEALVLSHSGLDNAHLTGIAEYAQSEKGWLSTGDVSSRPFLSAPHQILCATDRRVVCANTGRNVVSVFDFGRPNCFQEAGISSARWDRLSLEQITGDHLNSVFLRGDSLYVIAHGHVLGSKLATFSYPDLKLLSVEALGARTGLHNIWMTPEGQRIACHSECGSLIDLDDKVPLWGSGVSIYTRGLAACGDYVVVGESQKSGRDLRCSSISGLWILDRRNWQAVDYIRLGPYGAVNEVRVLDDVDDAHHGHPFKGLRSLLEKGASDESEGILGKLVSRLRPRLKGGTPRHLESGRLKAASAAFETRALWSGYQPILGSPTVLSDGAKQAGLEQLCLIVRPGSGQADLVFSYVLENKAEAHVSAVVDYRGSGGDRNMVALLLQPIGATAVLSLWRHDGQEWACLDPALARDLPCSGTMRLKTAQHQVVLSIDDAEVVTTSAEVLGLERCDEGLGMRWTGASVRPVVAGI